MTSGAVGNAQSGLLNVRQEINELDATGVANAATYNKEVSTGGPLIDAWSTWMKDTNGMINKLHGRFKMQLFTGGAKTYKVNAVITMNNTGRPIGLTALAVDGKKPAMGLPFIQYDGTPALYCDVMMELNLMDDSREGGTFTVPKSVVWKMVKFRDA